MPKKPDEMAQSRGVSLKTSEWQDIDQIADDLDWKPGAVSQYALRYFLKAWRNGEIKTKTRTTKELPEL